MTLEAIAPLAASSLGAAVDPTTALGNPGLPQGASALSFDTLVSGVEHLNGQLLQTQNAVATLATGGVDSLHHTVMGMEQTRLSFELMLAVRNKVLDAYQELMRMQV